MNGLALLFLMLQGAAAQEEEALLRAALYLSGASEVEQLDEGLLAALEAYEGRKIALNRDRLRPTLLLSAYQVASLQDYRARSGDILSWEELALVDGFSREAVEALRPFLSLDSDRLPGSSDTLRWRATALARATLTSLGGKARLQGKRLQLGGAWRGSGGSFHADYQAGAHRFVLGDFRLRYGQGLAFWDGFSMESLSTVEAFLKRSQDLSPLWSYSSANGSRGVAWQYGRRRWGLTAFATKSPTAGLHADYLGFRSHWGVTAAWDFTAAGKLRLSLDGRLHFRSSDLAFEGALRNHAPAGKAALRVRLGERSVLAGQLRALPSTFSGRKYGEYAMAGGWSFRSARWQDLAGQTGFGSREPVHGLSLTADAALLPVPGVDPRRFQLRAYALWQWQMGPRWRWTLRVTERYRNYENPRTALRGELRRASGPWTVTWRGEMVWCEKAGALTYGEIAGKTDCLSGALRLSLFHIDAWNDRIYCYERDAPGTFSVPAYSGRGGCLSAVMGGKVRWKRLTLKGWLRASCQLRVGREPAYTLNLQLQAES